MASRNLKDILKPNYGDGAGEIGTAPVVGESGSSLSFNAATRKVGDNVRINIGNSPNSNTGDPLRTAFIKVGNFMEAVYMADSDKDIRIRSLEKNATDSDSRFLGIYTSSQIDNTSGLDSDTVNAAGYIDSDSFAALKPGDLIVLTDNIGPLSRDDFKSAYDRAGAASRIDVDSVTLKNGEYSINAPAFLKIHDDGRFRVAAEFTADKFNIDFDGALARLQSGTQTSKLTEAEQKALYADFNSVTGDTGGSFRIDAKNMEDALAEVMARMVRIGFDAGYYG